VKTVKDIKTKKHKDDARLTLMKKEGLSMRKLKHKNVISLKVTLHFVIFLKKIIFGKIGRHQIIYSRKIAKLIFSRELRSDDGAMPKY